MVPKAQRVIQEWFLSVKELFGRYKRGEKEAFEELLEELSWPLSEEADYWCEQAGIDRRALIKYAETFRNFLFH